jgi:nucleoside triphosphate pyrophosphatase
VGPMRALPGGARGHSEWQRRRAGGRSRTRAIRAGDARGAEPRGDQGLTAATVCKPLRVGRRLVLASTSPARLYLLREAGLDPEVIPSGVQEEGVAHLPAGEAVLVLSERKGRAVRAILGAGADAALIIACDSMLEFAGQIWGKPCSRAEVVSRWQRLRGREGHLHTGHFVLDCDTGRHAGAGDVARVRFGCPTDYEIAAYSDTREALEVAGPFTLEGRSAPWIESIEGNYGTVTGVSLAVLRRLLRELGIEMVDLWR